MAYLSRIFWRLCAVGLAAAVVFTLSPEASAQTGYLTQEPILLAQNEDQTDDSYDPFADYADFDDNSEEEADINFFRNGRFVTMGFSGGQRDFTGTLGKIYSPSFQWGLFLSYFFDLRFALQFGYSSSEHRLLIDGDDPVKGSISLQRYGFALKFFMNTQNVTKGLAAINPYILAGLSTTERVITISGQDGSVRDSGNGVDVGFGIEFPLMRNKMFFGVQGAYQVVNFKDENTDFEVEEGPTGVFPDGDLIDYIAILGVNF